MGDFWLLLLRKAAAESTATEGFGVNILIVHAHYEPKSFTAAMKDLAVAKLSEAGNQVTISDLYAMEFNPVASKADFADPVNPDYIVYSLEQRQGWKAGTIAPDIMAECEKLLAADLVIFSFPVFWFSVPAIMKGWIDRVFLSGVCFGGRRFYEHGGLSGKRVLMAATIGGREHMFGDGAIHGPFEHLFSPLLRGTFAYVGMDVLKPFVAWHVPYVDDIARKAMLEQYAKRLVTVFEEVPLKLSPVFENFDSVMRPLAANEVL